MAFWKNDGDVAAGARDEEPGTGAGDVLLGPGVELEGKLTFAGTVRIDTRFKGTIVTEDVLVIGDRARIEADITCGTVIVHGEVNGSIRARNAVELHPRARVRCDVETPSLSIEKGAAFDGRSSMSAETASAGASRGREADREAGGVPAHA